MTSQPWIIWLDEQVTRRKIYHILTDQDGRMNFAARRLSQVLEHCRNNDIHKIALVSEQHKEWPCPHMALTLEENDPWQN